MKQVTGVTLGSTGGWSEDKIKQMAKGNVFSNDKRSRTVVFNLGYAKTP
jgi:hypothetical protein